MRRTPALETRPKMPARRLPRAAPARTPARLTPPHPSSPWPRIPPQRDSPSRCPSPETSPEAAGRLCGRSNCPRGLAVIWEGRCRWAPRRLWRVLKGALRDRRVPWGLRALVTLCRLLGDSWGPGNLGPPRGSRPARTEHGAAKELDGRDTFSFLCSRAAPATTAHGKLDPPFLCSPVSRVI